MGLDYPCCGLLRKAAGQDLELWYTLVQPLCGVSVAHKYGKLWSTYWQRRIDNSGDCGPNLMDLMPRNRLYDKSLADRYTLLGSLSQIKMHHLVDDKVGQVRAQSFSTT